MSEAACLAYDMIARRPVTKAAINAMALAIADAAPHDQPSLMRKAFAWCSTPTLKANLRAALPASISAAVIAAASPDSDEMADPLERVLLLSDRMHRSSAREFPGLAMQILAVLDEALQTCMSSVVPLPGDMQVVTSEDMDDTPLIALCRALGTVIPQFPDDLQQHAARQLLPYAEHALVHQLLQDIERFSTLPRQSPDVTAAQEFESLDVLARRKVAAGQLAKYGDPSLLMSLVEATNNLAVDDLLIWIGQLSTPVESSRLTLIATTLSQRNPRALCPQLILAPHTVTAASVLRPMDRARITDARSTVTACLLFAPPELAKAALASFSRIRDREGQTRTMLSMLPFLPPGANRQHFNTLQDAQTAGAQIAGMTTMMLDLSQAIDVDSLPEVVEATSKNQSEWWVVEALSVTVLRLQERSELQAIIEAAPRIRNPDLRARLQTRAAMRLVDLRFDALAIEVASSIELHALRWDALHEIAVRFASGGNGSSATSAAAQIRPRGLSQKAYVDVAFELGALEMGEDARRIVTEHAIDPEWKAYGEPVFSASASDKHVAIARKRDRALGERRLSRFELILFSGVSIPDTLGRPSPMDAVLDAAQRCDDQALDQAVVEAWCAPVGGGMPLCDILSALHRSSLLLALAQMAPMIDIRADSSEVVRMLSAIHQTGRWWP